MEFIETVPGVPHASPFGRGRPVDPDCGEPTIPAIAARLAEQGFAGARTEKIKPSLEDVFVSLIEAHDREETPQLEFER